MDGTVLNVFMQKHSRTQLESHRHSVHIKPNYSWLYLSDASSVLGSVMHPHY